MFRLMEPSSGDTSTSLTVLNCAFYMDPYVLCVLSCVANKVIIQRASLTYTNHLHVHRLSGSILNINWFKMY
jgi:hypothetical protein